MAEKNTAAAGTTEKKARKAPVRKPVELAVVARVTDGSGNVIPDANLEIIHASKDVAAAFRKFKENPGSDMTTFTLTAAKNEADVEKAGSNTAG